MARPVESPVASRSTACQPEPPAWLANCRSCIFRHPAACLPGGPPSGRRQYLNLANSQASQKHMRALQRYNRVLLQRNQVLRLVREGRQPVSALEPWTEQMLEWGALVLGQRVTMLGQLDERITTIFRDLAGSTETLRVAYKSTACDAEAALEPLELKAAFRQRQV